MRADRYSPKPTHTHRHAHTPDPSLRHQPLPQPPQRRRVLAGVQVTQQEKLTGSLKVSHNGLSSVRPLENLLEEVLDGKGDHAICEVIAVCVCVFVYAIESSELRASPELKERTMTRDTTGVYVPLCVCAMVCACVCMYSCMRRCNSVCVCEWPCMYVRGCVRVHIYVCVSVCVRAYVCACTCVPLPLFREPRIPVVLICPNVLHEGLQAITQSPWAEHIH